MKIKVIQNMYKFDALNLTNSLLAILYFMGVPSKKCSF